MKTIDSQIPRSIRLTDYSAVAEFVDGFAQARLNLLFLIGRPGLGKSQLVQRALEGKEHAWIDCHSTKLATYMKLYRHRDQPVVIDDENSWMSDSAKLDLLNSLCQTNPVKTIRWMSTTRLLEECSVPDEFQTRSPVLIITNRLRVVSPQVRAMIDRGLPLIFQPSAATIHESVADWFTDREIHEFIGKWLAIIPGLSMRDYVKAANLKAAGMDWRSLLHRQWKSGKLARVATLRADPSFATEEDRVRAFTEGGSSGSRAGYFRLVAKLRDLGIDSDSRQARFETATVTE